MSEYIPPKLTAKNTTGEDSQASVVTRTQLKTKRPPMYKVVIMNDDFTPMEFVIYVLKNHFHRTHEEAMNIVLQVHHSGTGVCGIYTRDVAETKVEQVLTLSRQNEHPLRCTMERE